MVSAVFQFRLCVETGEKYVFAFFLFSDFWIPDTDSFCGRRYTGEKKRPAEDDSGEYISALFYIDGCCLRYD